MFSIRTSTIALILFSLILVAGLFSAGWGIRQVQHARVEFSTAADAVTEIGLASVQVVSDLQRLAQERDNLAKHRQQQRLKVLLEKLETRHLSLFRGNPALLVDPQFREAVRSAYLAHRPRGSKAVRKFLILAGRMEESSPERSALKELRLFANQQIIPAMHNLLKEFQELERQKVSQAVLYIAIGISLIFLSAPAIWVATLSRRRHSTAKAGRESENSSVSPLLKEIHLMAGPAKQANALVRQVKSAELLEHSDHDPETPLMIKIKLDRSTELSVDLRQFCRELDVQKMSEQRTANKVQIMRLIHRHIRKLKAPEYAHFNILLPRLIDVVSKDCHPDSLEIRPTQKAIKRIKPVTPREQN